LGVPQYPNNQNQNYPIQNSPYQNNPNDPYQGNNNDYENNQNLPYQGYPYNQFNRYGTFPTTFPFSETTSTTTQAPFPFNLFGRK
jgi:hypothetical protein